MLSLHSNNLSSAPAREGGRVVCSDLSLNVSWHEWGGIGVPLWKDRQADRLAGRQTGIEAECKTTEAPTTSHLISEAEKGEELLIVCERSNCLYILSFSLQHPVHSAHWAKMWLQFRLIRVASIPMYLISVTTTMNWDAWVFRLSFKSTNDVPKPLFLVMN